MSDYPLVEIPPALTAALGAVPPPLVPPTYVPLPTYPSRPGLFTLQWAAWALFLGLIAVWLLAQDLTGGAGFLDVGSALAGWWADTRAGRQHERAVGAFHADFHQHQAYPALQQQYVRARADQSHPEAVARYRAWRVAQVLAGATRPRLTFLIAQNADFDAASRDAFRELVRRKIPLLGLYGGPTAVRRAAALRQATGSRRGAMVRHYPSPGLDCLYVN